VLKSIFALVIGLDGAHNHLCALGKAGIIALIVSSTSRRLDHMAFRTDQNGLNVAAKFRMMEMPLLLLLVLCNFGL